MARWQTFDSALRKFRLPVVKAISGGTVQAKYSAFVLKWVGCIDTTRRRARIAKCSRLHEKPCKMRIFRTLLGLSASAFFAAISPSASAFTLSGTSIKQLASACAPGVELSTLRAVAAVESHYDPLAVRDNTTHDAWTPSSLAAAIALAKDRLEKGHSVDIGLMQINSRNLASLGLGVEDAFDACRSLEAARRILLSAYAAGSNEPERQAAVLITLSRYNTGLPLAGIANGYADQVIAAQNAVSGEGRAQVTAPTGSPQWDIWGTSDAQHSSWIVTADGSSEIERAGAKSIDTRAKGRAAGPPITKGEPYELLAYQESEPGQP